jgi:UDP-3-O-[3-hydroxymyristoyl] glucosamine N-acyltransferase
MDNPQTGRFPGSFVSPEARIGGNVQIGVASHIYAWAEIGDDAVIGDYCIIGHPAGGVSAGGRTVIGPGSTVRSHTVVYQDVAVGPQFQTGHHGLVRERTRAGINLRMGTYTTIEGDCEIGDYTRLHGYVHVGKGSRIGNFVWLYSLTTLSNDALPPSHVELPVTIEDGVVVCIGVLLMPGAVLRKGAFICAGARAGGEVPPGAVVEGPRGQIRSHVSQMVHMETQIVHPWMRHYYDAYPPEAQPRIQALRDEILAQRRRKA